MKIVIVPSMRNYNLIYKFCKMNDMGVICDLIQIAHTSDNKTIRRMKGEGIEHEAILEFINL